MLRTTLIVNPNGRGKIFISPATQKKVDQNSHSLTRHNLNTNKDNVLKNLKYELEISYILVLTCHTG